MAVEHCMVVGASSGIGFDVARNLAKNFNVTALARREERLQELHGVGNVKAYRVDVTDSEMAEAAYADSVEHFGKVSRLIYCAGQQIVSPHRILSRDKLKGMIEVNFLGAVTFSQLFLNRKFSEPDACFCAVSSIAAVRPEPAIVAYAATKSALNTLIKGLAKEAAPRRFLAVAPGWLDTEMTASQKIYNDSFKEDLENRSPLGLTDLSDVVSTISYLTSKSASSITGQVVTVDSGMSL